ncbi:MAG: response regulator [Methanoregula sp.]|jgi:CheY-like chemotaxis protein
MTRKIVVVEDDQPILDLMGILLKKLNYEPVLIQNGPDALAYVRKEPPALILLDIMMSPVSGWEFLDTLRNEYQMREIPVILFTASPTVNGRLAERHDPMLGMLQKPVTFNELKTALRQFIS